MSKKGSVKQTKTSLGKFKILLWLEYCLKHMSEKMNSDIVCPNRGPNLHNKYTLTYPRDSTLQAYHL